ncbi:MAG: response regulator transcription factor [Zoogloea sp.]|nr:response regulator transcription factor [Zoogloea sp.]
MATTRLALLHDAPPSSALLSALRSAGHAVHVYNSRPGLLRELGRESFDLILLDETLLASDMRPFVDRLFTLAGEDTALIFIHCSDDEHRLADALALGADDFIRRGVGNREIAARIDAVLRRRQPLRYQPSLDHPPYFFDLETRRCHLDGREVMLTDKEFELAVFLFQHLGRIFSRGHLLDAVWRGQHTQSTRTIDTHISRLRRKLQLTDAQGFRLASAYGSGYRLERFEPDGRNPAETAGHPAEAEAAERCPPVC